MRSPCETDTVSPVLLHAVAALAIIVGLFAAGHTVANRSFSNGLFYAIALLELVLAVVLVIGIVAVLGTDNPVPTGLVLTYLVTMILVPPAAVLWGVAEKSRWGTGVVAVAILSLAILSERVLQLWTK